MPAQNTHLDAAPKALIARPWSAPYRRLRARSPWSASSPSVVRSI